MASNFVELVERLDSANDLLSKLGDQLEEFIRKNVKIEKVAIPSLVPSIDAYVTLEAEIPMVLRSQYGLIANEIRSCLDGGVATLAEANGKTPTGVSFPVARGKEAFEKAVRKNRKLTTQQQDCLASFEAYTGKNNIITGFHYLDRDRKHRPKICASAAGSSISIGRSIKAKNSSVKLVDIRDGSGRLIVQEGEITTIGTLQVGKRTRLARRLPHDLKIDISLLLLEPPELLNCEAIPALRDFQKEAQNITRALSAVCP